jgi:uncharacterized protein (TIGR02271 family)
MDDRPAEPALGETIPDRTPRRARRPDTVAAAPPRPRQVAPLGPEDRVVELREERLVAHREAREVGEVVVRTQVDEVPGRLEVEAVREEVEVEHVPVGEVVSERVRPWEEDGTLVVPVYEEQLVLVKRLVLREKILIRRVETRERRLFEDTLRKERLVVQDDSGANLVHERYPADNPTDEPLLKLDDRGDEGPIGNLVRRVLK